MQIALKEKWNKEAIIVDLKLRGGCIIERIAIDAKGQILGKVVGGHDGLDDNPLPFRQDDIIAYRKRGWAAKIGIAQWREAK